MDRRVTGIPPGAPASPGPASVSYKPNWTGSKPLRVAIPILPPWERDTGLVKSRIRGPFHPNVPRIQLEGDIESKPGPAGVSIETGQSRTTNDERIFTTVSCLILLLDPDTPRLP